LEKKKKQAIKAILSDEIMFNAGKSTVKRSWPKQIYAAIHFQASSHFSWVRLPQQLSKTTWWCWLFDRDIVIECFPSFDWKISPKKIVAELKGLSFELSNRAFFCYCKISY
jgi:hypothetical protein